MVVPRPRSACTLRAHGVCLTTVECRLSSVTAPGRVLISEGVCQLYVLDHDAPAHSERMCLCTFDGTDEHWVSKKLHLDYQSSCAGVAGPCPVLFSTDVCQSHILDHNAHTDQRSLRAVLVLHRQCCSQRFLESLRIVVEDVRLTDARQNPYTYSICCAWLWAACAAQAPDEGCPTKGHPPAAQSSVTMHVHTCSASDWLLCC